ncbi:MAG: MMPL family transporter, partial [Proteobacteria bacterium]|nr:MMPL family transporter [Pseudomonadota bacterium]
MTGKDAEKGFSAALFSRLFRHRAVVLITSIFLIFLLALSSMGIKLEEDIMDLLPLDDPVVQKHHAVLKGFDRMDMTFFDIGAEENDETASTDDLIFAADRLVEQLSSSSLFTDIYYKWDDNALFEGLNMLREYRGVLFTEEDEREIEKRLIPEELKTTLGNWKRLLTETPTPVISQAFYRDPLSLDSLLLAKITAMRSSDTSIVMEKGRIFSQDMKHLLILAKPRHAGTDNKRATELVTFIDEAIKKITSTDAGHKLHIAYLGSHRFSLDNSTMIKGDIKRTISISLAAILILSLLVYRRPILSLLTVLPALFGAFFASGIIRLFSPEISAISIGCGAMLAGIAVDYGIHLLFHIDESTKLEHDEREIIKTLGRLMRPLLFGVCTTVAAFMSLQISLMPGLRQLGLFAALGITGAFVFTLFVLPLIIPKRAARPERKPLFMVTNLFPPYFNWISKSGRLPLFLILIITVLSFYGLTGLEFEGDVQKLNAASKETRKDWKEIVSNFGSAMSSTSVAVKSKRTEDALKQNDLLYDELLRLKEKGLISGIQSVSNLLPGKEKQSENRQRWFNFWTEERREKLGRDIETSALELRIRPEILKRALTTLPGEAPSIRIDRLLDGFTGNILSNRVSIKEEETFILTNIKLKEYENYQSVVRFVEKSVPDAIITNGRYFADHMVKLIYSELKRFGGLAILLVTLIIIAYQR